MAEHQPYRYGCRLGLPQAGIERVSGAYSWRSAWEENRDASGTFRRAEQRVQHRPRWMTRPHASTTKPSALDPGFADLILRAAASQHQLEFSNRLVPPEPAVIRICDRDGGIPRCDRIVQTDEKSGKSLTIRIMPSHEAAQACTPPPVTSGAPNSSDDFPLDLSTPAPTGCQYWPSVAARQLRSNPAPRRHHDVSGDTRPTGALLPGSGAASGFQRTDEAAGWRMGGGAQPCRPALERLWQGFLRHALLVVGDRPPNRLLVRASGPCSAGHHGPGSSKRAAINRLHRSRPGRHAALWARFLILMGGAGSHGSIGSAGLVVR